MAIEGLQDWKGDWCCETPAVFEASPGNGKRSVPAHFVRTPKQQALEFAQINSLKKVVNRFLFVFFGCYIRAAFDTFEMVFLTWGSGLVNEPTWSQPHSVNFWGRKPLFNIIHILKKHAYPLYHINSKKIVWGEVAKWVVELPAWGREILNKQIPNKQITAEPQKTGLDTSL